MYGAGFPLTNSRSCPSYGYLSQSTYLRLFVGQFVQEQTQRIVYIDCDLLVVGDLSVVLDLDFGDCPVGESGILFLTTSPTCLNRCPKSSAFHGIPKGVIIKQAFVLSTGRVTPPWAWRRKRLLLGRGFVTTPPSAATRMCSNPVLAGHWLELPCTYNFCSQLLYIEEFLPEKRVGTAHFSVRGAGSTRKPRCFTLPGSPNPGITGRRIRELPDG